MAFDLVAAYAASETPFFVVGASAVTPELAQAPQQIALRFSLSTKIDPTTIASSITVSRSGGLGDAFANGNDMVVTPGYISVDDAPNENSVIIRFAETLPNDSYRITIGSPLKTLAFGSAPVEMFRNGGSFNLDFKLDLGAQVMSVVPQPVIRAKTITFSALPQDGDLLEVAIRGGRRVFEFDSGNGVQSGNTAISLAGKTTANLATDVTAAIDALATVAGFTNELGSASAAGTTVTVSGVNFTPVVKFTRGGTVPFTSPVRVGDGGLTQLASKAVVYFNAADPLDVNSVVPAAFKLFTLDSATGADTATVASPTAVSYDAASASAVLTFATDLAANKLYRLQIGQAAVTPKADVAEGSNANSTFTAAKDLGSLSGGALERISVKVTGAIDQTTDIVTPAGSLAYPRPTGDGTEPGHRDIPAENHLGYGGMTPGEIRVQAYNFNDYYGTDVQGNQLTNVITETQKQRAREIFDIYSRYTGIRFVETADQGITVITGDLRAFSPAIIREPVAGLGGFRSFAAMDSADEWGESEYGGYWFEVAMHEIGHALGLGHAYDIPAIMGDHYGQRLNLDAEPVFPGNYDRVHMDDLYPRAGTDIDLYRFSVAVAGELTAQTFVSRQGQPVLSQLDSMLTLYREVDGKREIVARNDDDFGRDSFIGLDLAPGTYFIAVTSTGNAIFNPEIPDSGYGGRTDGDYELRIDFSPAASVTSPLADTTGTPLDGDRDGTAGGEYKFWFQTSANTLFVDKAAYANVAAATTAGANGSLAKPYYRIQDAIAAATTGSIIRIIGNTGNAASAGDDRPYLIGTDLYGRVLEDGESFIVPKDVTVMIDAGATLKLRAANIDVGSSSSLVDRSSAALQVLGTPSDKVFFTSFHDDARGGDSDRFGPAAQGGQWGGLVFRGDSDFKKDRVLGTLGTSQNNDSVFLNSVSNAAIRYGGGAVIVDSFQQNFAPIHLESTRPSLVFNELTDNAGAPISADPNSFEDTAGRVGPEIRGNRLVANSINGIFVRIRTELGKSIDKLSVPARFRNTDAPYVLTENLLIDGGAGGYVADSDGDVFTRDAGRLQVDPGVVIKLWRSRIELERGRAQFIAEGMPNNRVVFTTLADNRFGGGGTFDTNGANLDVRTAGDWGGIIINAGAKASIDQAYIAFGGGETPIEGRFDNFSVIETHQGDLRLANSRIENNAAAVAQSDRDGRGRNDASTVFVRGAQPIVVGNDFRSNAGAMISVNANSLVEAENPDPGRTTGPIDRFTGYDDNRGPLVRENTTSYAPGSGALAGMRVRGEEITVESVWDDTDIVHVLQNEIIVQNVHTATGLRLQSSPNASLVVKLFGPNAGLTAAGYGLDIDDRIGGTVQVVGFPTKPVILTSLKDDSVGASYDPLGRLVTDTNGDGTTTTATAGDWRSLKFLPLSNDRNVAIVNEAEASYRGSSTTDPNGRIAAAQVLGVLAPNFATGTNTWESAQEKTGDENRRLGFEVHGAIALDTPGDNDVYSFQGYSGSEVWFDIDKTSPGLDAMLELLDAAGNVIARSADAQTDGSLTAGVVGAGLPLTKDAWRDGDFYGTNPRDPGMRVILPTRAGYPLGSLTQYYVRVRSQAAYGPTTTQLAYESGLTATTSAALAAGASTGEYELRIRLRQRDEKPGSTVRSADIRFPTTGIDVLGLPHNSQVLGETAEANVDANNVWTSAQKVGNLLAVDRNTISVGGELSSATDIDWFQFDLDIQQIQSIAGVNAGGKTWSMVFDLDYADGIRGDFTISVFDSAGKLIYVGRDSDVEADQPGAGQGNNDLDDLSRGSVGKLDPFIGPIQMPATAGRYYVAVSSNEQLPLALNATFRSDAANAQIRLEPVNSLNRVVEDHIGSIGYKDSSKAQINPTTTTPLIDISSAVSLSTHVTPFTLSDVTLFLSSTGGLFTHDAVTGARETTISTAFGGLSIGDIDIRPDGKLYAYAGVAGDPATVGQLMELDSGNGNTIAISRDAIPNATGANFQTSSDAVTAMTFGRSAPGTFRDLYLVVASGGQSKLYRAANGGSATTAADAAANQDKASPLGYQGRIGIDFNSDGDCDDAGERPQVTGLQYIDDITGTLYGVTADGKLLQVNPGVKSADEKIDFDAVATVIADYGSDLAKVGATGFTALATTPQNLYGGALRGKFFALTNTGRLVLLNPTATTNKAATLNGTAGLLQRTGDTGGSIFVTGDTSGVVALKGSTSGVVKLDGSTTGSTFTASTSLPTSVVADMIVLGEGVAYNTTVRTVDVNTNTFTLSKPVAADGTGTFTLLRAVSPARTVTGVVNPAGGASATVELNNATDIVAGMLVFSGRLPVNTVVTSAPAGSNQITLSNAYPVTDPESLRMLFVRPDATELGTTSVGSSVITGINTAGLRPGMAVLGLGIPAGATVVSKTETDVTLSLAATNGAQTTLHFLDGRNVRGIADTSTIKPGMVVKAGPNIAPNTRVTSVDAAGIVLSQGAGNTSAVADLTFLQPVVSERTGDADGTFVVSINTAQLAAEMGVIGTNVPANTKVLFINSSSQLTLSNPLPEGTVSLTFYSINDGTPVVLKTPTNLATAGIKAGMLVFGSGIANNTTVKAFDPASKTLTLSKPAAATVVGAELRLVMPELSYVSSSIEGNSGEPSKIYLPGTVGLSTDMVALTDSFTGGYLITGFGQVAFSVYATADTRGQGNTFADQTVNFLKPDVVRKGAADPAGKTLTIVTDGLHVGMLVFGAGVPYGTVITAKTGGRVTLSNAVVPGDNRFAFVRDGRVVSSLSGMANLTAGQAVTGTAIPADVTVTAINAADREITLSQSVTAAALTNTLTFTGTGVTNAIIGNLPTTANLSVGMTVIGSGVSAGTTIASIDDYKSITLSSPVVTAGALDLIFVTAGQLASPAVTRNGTTTTDSAVVSLANVSDLRVGMLVQGTSVATNAVIVSRNITANTITLSANSTASGTESLKFISTSTLDYLADWSENYNVSPVLAAGATGIAFSPLDINLWHPTERRGDTAKDSVTTPDPGHGINAAPDNSRLAAGGGTSMYFGLETWAPVPAYQVYPVLAGQYGVTAPNWQADLTTNTGRGDTYNLPGGASGSLTTNSFSLQGYKYTNKPTLYFTYWLDTQDATDAKETAQDAARVSVSKDGGATWEVIASNKKTDLPRFPSVSSKISGDPLQLVQELFDSSKTTGWRQARIDIGNYADEADLRLRFDFTTGLITAPERGQNNSFEGFYIDDIIVGFAERGEMVTGAKGGLETIPGPLPTDPAKLIDHSSFFAAGTPAATDGPPPIPAQFLMGAYQLEMRRGIEYGVNTSPTKADVAVAQTFDTDDILIRSLGTLGDENLPREQGQFLIEGNWIANAKTYGISIDAGERDPDTGAPASGAPRKFSVPNNSRLAPGAVVVNNVISSSGTAGILFSGEKFTDLGSELITNGSFEATNPLLNIGRGVFATENGSTSLVGWTLASGSIDIKRSSVPPAGPIWPAATGEYFVDTSGTGPGVLQQTLSTVVGETYTVQFSMAGNPDNAPQTKRLRVSSVGSTTSSATFTQNTTPVVANQWQWERKTWTFVATSSSTILRFESLERNEFGMFLDDVSVRQGIIAPLAAVPYGRIVNNTIYGGATQTGIGVQVTENAAPTLLNNLFSGLTTAIDVDTTSVNDGLGNLRTVIGTSAFHNVGTPVKGATASQSLTLSTNPFVAAQFANFYLAEGGRAIDSALNTLQDRAEYNVITSPLGISVSPIVAPGRDIYGQLRGDDPKQASVPGLGSSIFKDRGATERIDFTLPLALLVTPEDQSSLDLNPEYDDVIVLDSAVSRFRQFELQLTDGGAGIDPATVVSEAFTLTRDGVVLKSDTDYLFRYIDGTQRVVFEAPAVFLLGSYVIRIDSRAAADGLTARVTDRGNNPLLPNSSERVGETDVLFTQFRILLTETAVPGAPTAVGGTPGEDHVVINWTAPASAGITPISDYVIQYAVAGTTNWSDYEDGESLATTATVADRVPGTGYVFRVAAKNSYGVGPFSAASAVITPQQLPPGIPTNVAGTSGNRQVVVTWTAPSSPGTQPITDYHVEYSSDAGANWTRFADGVGTGTTATVTGLTNGTAYLFQVRAVNIRGESAWAQSVASVTPLTAASAPTGVAGTRGDRQVALTWTAPADNGGSAITDYVVQYRTDVVGSSWLTFADGTSAAASATVTGLLNGTAYRFRVAAVTGFGDGAYSAESGSVTPLAAAAAPTGVAGTSGNSQVALIWTAPSSNGGSAISDYVVEYRTDVVGSSWQAFADGTSTVTSATVTGLTNGTAYRFRVTAVTGFGLGTPSSESAAVTPLTVASAVTSLTGAPGDRRVTLNWVAPSSTGGSPITDYVVQYRTHATLQSWQPFADGVSAATQAVVTGLENGTSYRFRVAAVTAAGESTNWTVLTNVTPATVPGVPTGLVVEPSDGSVSVAWAAPSSGGAAITDYIVQYRTNIAGSPWQTFSDGVSTGTVATVTGLTNATAYVFRVSAVNAMGQGQPTAESSVATPGPQAAGPTRLTGRAGDGSVALAWTSPTVIRGQQIVDYAIDFRAVTGDVAGPWQRASDGVSTATAATVGGLVNSQAYEFRVAAITTPGNIVGIFSDVSARLTPQALPPAPASLSAKKQTSTSVALSWAPPLAIARTAGPAVTGYVVQYRETTSGRWVTREVAGSATSSVISKLSSRKSYVFRVAARSAAGLGAFTGEVRV